MTLPAAVDPNMNSRQGQAHMCLYAHEDLCFFMRMYMLMDWEQMQRSTGCIVYYALRASEQVSE